MNNQTKTTGQTEDANAIATESPAVMLGTDDPAQQLAAVQQILRPESTIVITTGWRGLGVQVIGGSLDVAQVETVLSEVIRQLRDQERQALRQAVQAAQTAAQGQPVAPAAAA